MNKFSDALRNFSHPNIVIDRDGVFSDSDEGDKSPIRYEKLDKFNNHSKPGKIQLSHPNVTIFKPSMPKAVNHPNIDMRRSSIAVTHESFPKKSQASSSVNKNNKSPSRSGENSPNSEKLQGIFCTECREKSCSAYMKSRPNTRQSTKKASSLERKPSLSSESQPVVFCESCQSTRSESHQKSNRHEQNSCEMRNVFLLEIF